MDTVLQDLRYALRTLLRSPGFTASAVACLALGIGANATIFGVVDTLLFRPPAHVENPARVVRLYFNYYSRTFGPSTSSVTGYPVYTLIRDSARALDEVAAYAGPWMMSLGRGVDARPVDLQLASSSYFPLLGVRPALGRFYATDEDRPGGPAVLVLSHSFWRAAFGGDSGVLGRSVQLGRRSYTVIGVAPERFTGVNLENVDVWAPLTTSTAELMGPAYLNRGSYFLQIIGRVRPGGRLAAQHAATLAFRAEDRYSRGDSNAVVLLGPVQQARGPEMSQNAKVSTWLAAVSAIVLLVACANVANLLLVRSMQRQREMAVRLSLGAGRWRLARQLLTESVLLSFAGSVGAVFVTLWMGPVIRAFLLPNVPALAGVDGRVLAFTAVAALVTGLLAGAAPAGQVGRRDLTPALKAGVAEGRYQRSRLRAGLLVGQVALTVILIMGAGLFARSLRNVEGQDFGFDPAQTLVATMDLSAAGYRSGEINSLHMRMLERLQALPDVEAASATVGHPFGSHRGCSASVPGRDSIPILPTGGPYCQQITPGYFAAMGTPVRGRTFTSADRGAPVVIVNQTMARVLWPGETALGKCIIRSDKRCAEIVGVVPDARRFKAVEDVSMHFYEPFAGDSSEFITALVLRARGRPEDVVAPVRQALHETAANLPFANVTPISDLVAPSIRPWRLGSAMFGAFALLALILAAVGLYGVLAYTVTQRTHEVGVRVALGAARADVVQLIVGQGLRVTLVGLALGLLGGVLGGRVLSSMLYGVSSRDPLVLAAGALALLVVALIASYLPARRASRVDPMVALRTE